MSANTPAAASNSAATSSMSTAASNNNDVATPFSLPATYAFPTHRIAQTMEDSTKTPLCLVACGSFSPVTHLHLRMFEMAVDFVRQNTAFEVVAGYLSPVSDSYKKAGLAPAHHRVRMCELACENTSSWLMIDPWEAMCPEYQPTAKVLDHFEHELNTVRGGAKIVNEDGEQIGCKKIRVVLLAGSDLIKTMSEPGVWSPQDLDHILGRYGSFIIERAGTEVDDALDGLSQWRNNIHVIRQLIQNDVSSTKIRLFLKRGMSVLYLLPTCVIDYIFENNLYIDEDGRKPHMEPRTPRPSSRAGTSNNNVQNHDQRLQSGLRN